MFIWLDSSELFNLAPLLSRVSLLGFVYLFSFHSLLFILNPSSFPPPQFPPVERFGDVFADAIAVAVVAFAISVSMVQLFARKHSYETDSNQVKYIINNYDRWYISWLSFQLCFFYNNCNTNSIVITFDASCRCTHGKIKTNGILMK